MEERYLSTPLPCPLVPLPECGGYALLCRGVYQPRDIVWHSGGGGINCVGRQDGGVASAEDASLGVG